MSTRSKMFRSLVLVGALAVASYAVASPITVPPMPTTLPHLTMAASPITVPPMPTTLPHVTIAASPITVPPMPTRLPQPSTSPRVA
jgi:hypothetical protein